MRIRTTILGLALLGVAGFDRGASAGRDQAVPAQPPAIRIMGMQLRVDETPLLLLKHEVRFTLHGIWRYDPEKDRWIRVLKASVPLTCVIAPTRPDEAANARVLLDLPESVGLYYVSWEEDGALQGGLGFNGPVRCQDVMLGDPPAGKVAACVPFGEGARAQFVPDPRLYCK